MIVSLRPNEEALLRRAFDAAKRASEVAGLRRTKLRRCRRAPLVGRNHEPDGLAPGNEGRVGFNGGLRRVLTDLHAAKGDWPS